MTVAMTEVDERPFPVFRNSSFDNMSIEEYGGGQYTADMDEDTDPCSCFYRCVLKQKSLEYMESSWLPGIQDEIRNWKGFRHRLVITPPGIEARNVEDEFEFVVILYFVGINNLRSWSTSPEVSPFLFLSIFACYTLK